MVDFGGGEEEGYLWVTNHIALVWSKVHKFWVVFSVEFYLDSTQIQRREELHCTRFYPGCGELNRCVQKGHQVHESSGSAALT